MLWVLVVAAAAAQHVTVNTRYGPITVGKLRFMPPVVPQSWSEPKNCTIPQPECAQGHVLKKKFSGSEDCLFGGGVLCCSEPITSVSANLPVLVWIHGGAFIFGNGIGGNTTERFNGSDLATEHNVIVVSLQYRLNVFGFLALSSLLQESGTTGNYGLQDQRLALQWVQDNIAAFGGDPSHTLLFGQSAGGGSVCYHFTSLESAGLFSAIVAESPVCSDEEFFQDLDVATTIGAAFVKHVGCGDNALTLTCLRALPADDVLNYILTFPENLHLPPGTRLPLLSPIMDFTPVVDGSQIGIVDRPLALIEKGIFNRVPSAFGSSQNDGALFVPLGFFVSNMSIPITDQAVFDMLMHFYNSTDIVNQAMNVYYPASQFFDNYERISTIIRDDFFACNVRSIIRGIQQAGGPPTWLYRFNMTIKSTEGELFGDFHSAEIPFVFNNPRPYWNEEDQFLSRQMGCFWTSMARSGTPNDGNCTGMPAWPENTGVDGDWNIFFDVPLGFGQDLSKIVCDFWATTGL